MIDVMEIPCVFCGALPIEELDDKKMVYCKNCDHSVTKHAWQEVAIEYMSACIVKYVPDFRVYFYMDPKKKKVQFFWGSHFELRGPFPSRAAAIHAARMKLTEKTPF